MSEHLGIKGRIRYYHMAYDDPYSITWCPHCKESTSKAEICLHEGFDGHWVQFICTQCDKTIWTAKLGKRKLEKLNRKCYICKKPTSYYNCYTYTYELKENSRGKYLCSKKCYNKFEKMEDEN